MRINGSWFPRIINYLQLSIYAMELFNLIKFTGFYQVQQALIGNIYPTNYRYLYTTIQATRDFLLKHISSLLFYMQLTALGIHNQNHFSQNTADKSFLISHIRQMLIFSSILIHCRIVDEIYLLGCTSFCRKPKLQCFPLISFRKSSSTSWFSRKLSRFLLFLPLQLLLLLVSISPT